MSKIEAIKAIDVLTKVCDVWIFVGLLNYFRVMWCKRTHTLAPLTKICSTMVKSKWTDVENNYFLAMKKIVGRDVLLYYPHFSENFIIHTDARKTQLGGLMIQNGKPTAFYSSKLTPAQINYTNTERELLSIVKILKEFRKIMLGHRLIVYTNHKNLTFENLTTEIVLCWRLMLE